MANSLSALDAHSVLITGGARRIGAELARRTHAAGARVGVHYRSSSQEADALCDELNAHRPESARAFQADLADSAAPDELVDAFVAWAGDLSFLINNASSFYPTPLGSIDEDAWDDLIGTNLKAPLFLSQAAAPELRAANGAIVNIVDIHAQRPLRNHSVYGSAKAGLAMLTRSLAKDLAPDVRVNGVAPGAILWPEGGMSNDAQQSILAQIPLARVGTPRDIAEAVLFLLSASYVTGQIIAIDGGRSIGW